MTRRVAIIGNATRFPGVPGETLWQSLLAGRDLVTEVHTSRWDWRRFYHPDRRSPGTSVTFAAGTLGDIGGFDADFFGISPREAATMDPQQRLLLELTWEALEHAGIPPSRLRGSRCGVYIGISSPDFAYRHTADLASLGNLFATGNTFSIAANRLSYVFDLKGPSMAIDTACSSSLVAFHQACQAIRAGECDTALTGGVSLHLHPFGFVAFSKAGMLSPRGRCRVFSEDADGYVRSEGAGVFVLKALDQALADGDPILAEVAASGTNTDGHKSGLTVPSAQAQAQLLTEVYARAGIAADGLDYLEAHGTGTAVGDPIEVAAIGQALGRYRRHPLPIGSVKSNIGHLETAAGIAGLYKALGCLTQRFIPASIGVDRLNPELRLDEANLDVVLTPRTLPESGALTVGINSFGFGGANAHVVLTTPPPPSLPPSRPTPQRSFEQPLPLLVSAHDEEALAALASQLGDHLETRRPALDALTWTLVHHRERLDEQALALVRDHAQAKAALNSLTNTTTSPHNNAAWVWRQRRLDAPQGPVFVYTGNGCQWFGMGRELLSASPIFADAVARVDEHFLPIAGFSLLDVLARSDDSTLLEDTVVAQPALFAIQVGITAWLAEAGITPTAVVGHSVGEVAAGWACGALSLAEAVTVIAHRSRLQGLVRHQGGMTAVSCSADTIAAWLDQPRFAEICLAGDNSDGNITLAGPLAALAELEDALRAAGHRYLRLALDYPFHSPLLDGLKIPLLEALADLDGSSPRLPMISTVDGGETHRTLDADYWWQNLRAPVRFRQAIEVLVDRGDSVLVEIGAHPLLKRYIEEQCRLRGHQVLHIATLTRQGQAQDELIEARARLWLSGALGDVDPWFERPLAPIELPAYPWQRRHHWTRPSGLGHNPLEQRDEHPLLGARQAPDESTWIQRLSVATQPSLADHRVGETPVLAAAAQVEMVLAAAITSTSDAVVEINDLEILTPLVLDASVGRLTRLTLADQGRVQLTVRDLDPSAAWQPHLNARLAPGCQGSLLHSAPPLMPASEAHSNGEACPGNAGYLDDKAWLDSDTHLALARAMGLDYRGEYRSLGRIWRQDDEAIGEFLANDDAACWWLPPGLLDGALQLCLPLMNNDRAPLTMGYLPVRLSRMQFDRNAGRPTHARAVITRRSPHSFTADLWLYRKHRCIAALEEVRFAATPLTTPTSSAIERLITRLTPASLTPTPLGEEGARLADALAGIVSGPLGRDLEELSLLFDRLNVAWLEEAFASVRPAIEGDGLGNNELCRRLLAQYPTATLATPPASGSAESPAATDIWKLLLAEYPRQYSLLGSLGRLGLNLPGLLEGSVEHIEGLTLDAASLIPEALWQALHDEVLAGVSRFQSTLPSAQRLHLVEAGCAAPRLSEALSLVLDPDRLVVDILPTDDGSRQRTQPLIEGSKGAASLPPFHTAPGAQLAWVVSTPTDLAASIEAIDKATARLAPLGQLLVLVLPCTGWWQALGALRPDARPATLEAIRRHLSQAGFSVEARPPTDASHLPTLLLAVPSASARPTTEPRTGEPLDQRGAATLLVVDAASRALGERLVQHMPSGAARCISDEEIEATLAAPSALAEVTSARAANARQGPSALKAVAPQVVDLRAAAPSQETGSDLEHHQAGLDALERLGDWARALADHHVTLVVVTHGVAALFDTDAPAIELYQTALWGGCRSLDNELPNTRVRLVDLAPGEAAFETLVQDLQHDDGEDEVVIDHHGHRRALRVRPLADVPAAPTHAPAPDYASTRLTLEIAHPGQLSRLQWRTRPAQSTLARDQVRVKVLATGLNFRDVMYALGVLTDEALEQGFSGATLGLEFSGIVEALGDGVTRFEIGDPVVGLGSACFSNRLVVDADSLARVPEGVDPVAAAGLPTAFLTAWYSLEHLARLSPGERVLIHGAAGGVGLAAVQLARWRGAEVLATAGSPHKRDLLTLLGVERCYDSRSLAFAEQILADTDGQGVDVVLNSLSGDAIHQNLRVLAPFGRFLELGKRDFYQDTPMGLRPFRHNLSYFGIDSDQLLSHRPALARQLFRQVMDRFAEGTFSALPYTTFAATRAVEAFRHMQQSRHIGKIIVRPPLAEAGPPAGTPHTGSDSRSTMPPPGGVRNATDRSTVQPCLTLDTEGCYLVSGGLSGLGLASAERLVRRGARHLLLLSRSGVSSPETSATIAAMQGQGVTVEALALNVTDEQALARLIEECGSRRPPLRGVIHAAAVIEDGLARQLTREQLDTVLGAKLLGAILLDRLTRHHDLQHFVLYSSATTLFGSPGQSAYVAANLGLEALAVRRRQSERPATCLSLGIIEDTGFLARHQTKRRALSQRMGGGQLNAEQALDALERALETGVNNVTVIGAIEHGFTHRRFIELQRGSGEADTQEGGIDGLDLSTLDEPSRRKAVEAILRQQLASILMLAPERIDSERRLSEFGFDSLMAVELVSAIETRLGVKVSALALADAATLHRTTQLICELLESPELDAADDHAALAYRHAVSPPATAREAT
ncbi:SDR family NAD(P)-dependent oxidoreductase [Halomonas litopenaei]|uniref:SDR family NAD(P)-dependent oxidoreductase n=1 Tax=Halomonas litopenaei TaxID=2109328 RepID=UPI003F9F0090